MFDPVVEAIRCLFPELDALGIDPDHAPAIRAGYRTAVKFLDQFQPSPTQRFKGIDHLPLPGDMGLKLVI